MTDTLPSHYERDNEHSKRSLSPDEGEIIEDIEFVKRRRESHSPTITDRHANGDRSVRRHRIVYDDDERGRGYRDNTGYNGRRYYDSKGHKDYDRHNDRHRNGSRDDRWYTSHSRERVGRKDSPSGIHVPRNRSMSTESRENRAWTSSPHTSTRNTRSPSPAPKKVQFTQETKPAPYNLLVRSKLTVRDLDPIPEPVVVDEDALIEARRRKREVILAKYHGQSTPSVVDNLKLQSTDASPRPESPAHHIGIALPLILLV